MEKDNTPHLYIISGLGADHRVFANLNLPIQHTHLPWIENNPNESLTSYAKRMAEKIKHDNPIIMGLSFGGIVAQEIASFMPVNQLILLSTIKGEEEKPWYFKLIDGVSLFDKIPSSYFHKPRSLTYWAFSLVKEKNKEILRQCFDLVNEDHIKWAIHEILAWKGVKHSTKTTHIHSVGDRIFPITFVKPDHIIEGGHFALYTHSKQVNTILKGLDLA
jgi:pimeloyl-ACP methyl ester carboxylesterase